MISAMKIRRAAKFARKYPEAYIKIKLREWEKGEPINDTEGGAVACANCGLRYKRLVSNKLSEVMGTLRFFPHTHGFLCAWCCITLPLCIKAGCPSMSTDERTCLCREHYMARKELW